MVVLFSCVNFSTSTVEDSPVLEKSRLIVAATFGAHSYCYGSRNHMCRRVFARRQAHQF